MPRTSWSALAADACGSVGVLGAQGRLVGDVLVADVTDVGRRLAVTAVTAVSAPRCAEPELAAGLAGLDSVAARVHRLTLALLVEAHSRGLHLDTGLSVHDWVAQRCPGLTRPQVGDLASVVKAWDAQGHACLRDAVSGGQVSVARAARLVRALARVAPVTDPGTYEQMVGLLTPVAAHGSDKDLRMVTEHLLAVALSQREGEAKAKACHDSRGVHESSLADGSLRRFIVTADAEGAAVIHAILASPLAAPAPDETGPDPRTASQRRYDALMSVLGRGMSSPEGTPTTAKAKIFLTIPFTALALSLAGALAGSSASGCRDATNPFGEAAGPMTGDRVLAGWAAIAAACATASTASAAAGAATTGAATGAEGPAGETAAQGLLAGAAVDGVLTGAAAQGLLDGTAMQGLLDGTAIQGLVAGGAAAGGLLGGLAPGGLARGGQTSGGQAPGGSVWPAPGVGRTFTGEALTPGQVRRLACQADLIPTVLGTHSEVMDLGRESRVASAAQLKKLWLRDQECTFPGCTVPATWCDAHHVLWWIRGGRTDILNLALLCPRHHSIVHDKDLIATIDATGVTWHL